MEMDPDLQQNKWNAREVKVIFSCQSIVICTILGNVFLESFQAHIEDDNNIRAVEVSKIFFTFRGLYQTEPSGGGEMARLLTNGAPLAEDQQPISHRNNCENRNVKWKEVDVADMVLH